MPWCDPCEKSWTPTSVNADGTCPQCGEEVDVEAPASPEPQRIPWHFWLTAGAISMYLLWRLLQLVLLLF